MLWLINSTETIKHVYRFYTDCLLLKLRNAFLFPPESRDLGAFFSLHILCRESIGVGIWLRSQEQLLFFQSLVPSIHVWQFTMTLNSSSKGSDFLSCPPWYPHVHFIHAKNIHTNNVL